jgi:hypothetical protein
VPDWGGQKAVRPVFCVGICTDDLPAVIEPKRPGFRGVWNLDRGEDTIALHKAAPLIHGDVIKPHNLAVIVDIKSHRKR